MRGDLVSRPIGDVLGEARRLFEAGVKELLVVSQDTSAYGVDVKYRTGFWDGKPVKTRMFDLCEQLGQLADGFGAWVRLHYVYPYPHVDEIIPLMASGRVLPYLDVPFQHAHPDVLKRMKRPASGERNLERLARWREICPQIVVRSTFIAGFPGETEASSRRCSTSCARRGSTAPAASPIRRWAGPQPTHSTASCRPRCARSVARVSWRWPRKCRRASSQQRVGATMQVLVDHAPALGRKGGVGRSYADAPEIDGQVRLLPPEKASKTLKVGEFTRARIVGTQGHDLVGLPI